ncbi:MAG: RdgB/HAM1 family non-canonical purine NTP pyrophosphatase [Rikenellaceae bacterium]
MNILFATNNKHKLEEVQNLLPEGFAIKTPRDCGITEEIPETADTLEGNALMKARYLFDRSNLNVFADDTGLEVEALGGAPGVRSARYATDGHDPEANNKLLMKNLDGAESRKAQFRTVIALILDGEEFLFEGIVRGEIATSYSGSEGFGYDPIFIPEGESRTFAEMSIDEKGEISHRGRATRKLVEFLSTKSL